jgi:glycosyltransferase involved in cell wall biosynthesis
MAYGVPLVAAAATALPEVVGEAGRLVDPGDVDGWAAAITALLEDPVERDRLARAGARRAQGYTWPANAAALAGLYHRALEAP